MSRATLVETLLLVLPLVIVGLASSRTRLGARSRSLVDVVGRWVRRNPATCYLVAVVLIHVVFIETLPHGVQQLVLRSRSTNLHQLQHNPLYVLLASAFWITPGGFAFVVVMAVAVLGPAERLFGTARWLIAFFTGHVGATLIVAVWLHIAVHHGLVGRSISHTIDVGVSYGAYCVVFAVAPAVLLRWRRITWLAGFGLMLAIALAVDHTFTDLGHACAALLGVALWPLFTRDAAVRARAPQRWWNQPMPRHRTPSPHAPSPTALDR